MSTAKRAERVATRPATSPRPPLRGRFGALRADARPFAVDRAARRGRFAPRAYPTARRDGETRVPRVSTVPERRC